jgi:hypothetical protein
VLHVVTQLPALHDDPEACGSLVVQTWLQLPQFMLSICSLTQLAPHAVAGGVQERVHCPAPLHVWPPVHTVVQVPQWLLSVCSSTHVPPQSV